MAPSRPDHLASNRHRDLHRSILAALFKSKPLNLSLRDYLASIRLHITSSTRSRKLANYRDGIDPMAFWQNACTKHKAETARLQARIAELEDSVANGPNTQSNGAATAAAPKKQKRRPKEPVVAASSKRQKPDPLSNTASLSDFTTELEPPQLDTLGDAYLNHFFIFRQAMSKKKSSAQEIGNAISQVAVELRRLLLAMPSLSDNLTIGTASSPNTADKPQTKNGLDFKSQWEKPLIAIGQSVVPLLQGLDRLDQLPGGDRLQGFVVYRITEVLSALLRAICELAIVRATKEDSRALRSQPTMNGAIDHSVEQPGSEDDIVHRLCQLVVYTVKSLDVTKRTHRSIMDGFLYHLIRAVGRRLGFLVNGPWEERLPLVNVKDSHGWEETDEVSEDTTTTQAPYLIWVLKRVLYFASKYPLESDDSNDSERIAEGYHTDTDSFPRKSLSATVRTKLQHTLCTAMYGIFGSEKHEPALQRPQDPLEPNLNGPLATEFGEMGQKDWFFKEVWGILGWEVLLKNIQSAPFYGLGQAQPEQQAEQQAVLEQPTQP